MVGLSGGDGIEFLARAFRLDTFEGKAIVAFVGGGGKTTAMFMLADELAGQGQRVVTTTTTRLFASQRAQSPAWCAAGKWGRLGALLDEHGQCLVTSTDVEWEDGKARGLSVEQVAALAARDDVDALLIEADGSRVRPFKA
ncbi:MAG: selenium cofactor biosynthesis protein YqeC, partial [Chloroflexota bacterium]|nr:selenium cofactor biosynthesis protein YqeC [Chloroflexota bacterium]